MRWINGTQSSFSECFFSIFTLDYFVFHRNPLWASKYNFPNSARTALVKGFFKGSCNSVRWNYRTQSSFSESFFPVLTEDISFLPYPSMVLQISLSKFHKNRLSERILEGKAVTLWDELTEHRAVSQKASFQFLTEDIPFFTVTLYGLPNITLQIPQEQS